MNLHEFRLTDRFEKFIAEEVASGRYADGSEVVISALDLLERHTRDEETKRTRLLALLDEGIAQLDRGEGDVLETPEEIREYIAAIGKRVEERIRREEGV